MKNKEKKIKTVIGHIRKGIDISVDRTMINSHFYIRPKLPTREVFDITPIVRHNGDWKIDIK